MNTVLATRNAGAPPATQHHARHSPRVQRPRARQRGISMFIVMIILLLALILVIGGLAVANLNESVVGNQSDAQRAYGAAQALMDAAQRDIRLNGLGCDAAFMGGEGFNPDFTVTVGTTPAPAPCTKRFPHNADDYEGLFINDKISQTGGCAVPSNDPNLIGICVPLNPVSTDFSTNTVGSNALIWKNGSNDNGLTYNNKFITALDADKTSDYGGDAKLGTLTATATTAALNNGRYWIEVFFYNTNSVGFPQGMANTPVPAHDYPFIFRITAMAKGLRGDTVSVLRSYYTPYPMPAAP